MRFVGRLLLALSAILTGHSVLWWANFYQSAIKRTPLTLHDAFPCLYSHSAACSLIRGTSRLAEVTPYSPAMFWSGVALLAASAIILFQSLRQVNVSEAH